jgi:hypothetical protein
VHYSAEKLNEGEDFDGVDIGGEGYDHYGPHDESSMPSVEDVVWVVKNDESLDLGCYKIADAGDGCLPRKDGDPSCRYYQL